MADRPRKALILARGGRRLSRVERQVLERVEQALPPATHLQIWTELEIFDLDGTVHELDAVALGHYGLYVLDLKDLSGRLEGDDRTRAIEGMRRQHVVNATLSLVRENARRLEDCLVQELGREGLLVEPLVLLTNGDLEIALPESTRRHVVTAGEMLHALLSGELPGDVMPPGRVPIDASTAQAIASNLGGLRRRVRPGYGSFQQELAVLQRDIVADLTANSARKSDSIVDPSIGERGDGVRYRIEEIAAVWVIACVFIRALEERGYIERQLAGEGVEDRQHAFLTERSSRTPLDYLKQLFSTVGLHSVCDAIVGRSNHLLWNVAPSDEGAAALLLFFRRSDGIRERQDLADSRLWGDLFQSISEPLRKANAAVQTPSFIEGFLLDRTLHPAIADLGVSGVRVLDPACGSGTLLVGAFLRLLACYPSTPNGQHALSALEQVHGVDISPAATMLTRIRLLLTYCEVTGCARISDVPALPLHVVTADSLLPDDVFRQRYSVVICAPPLITGKDVAQRDAYRERYKSAAGRFPISSPFIERCFQLAAHGGFVGLIVGSSFTKREFGKPLVEEVLSTVDLTHVVDTSGAYIPGYGAPTMILLGRNRSPSGETVRVVVGKRGEPITPMDPAEGRVWSAIVEHLDQVGFEDDYIAVSDVRREQLAKHPWLLGARDVISLHARLEQGSVRLRDRDASILMGASSGLDQVFILPRRTAERLGLESEVLRPLVRGEAIRDFSFSTPEVAVVPPVRDRSQSADQHFRWWAWLQRYRPLLANRRSFGSFAPTLWWTWLRAPRDGGSRLCVIGPVIARNTHFALAPSDVVASRTVLVIEPAAATSEAELYSWLAFLNSSTASFWLKQRAYSKGHSGSGVRPEEPGYEFSGILDKLLIPRAILEPGALRDELVALTRQLERTARELAAAAPEQVLDQWDRSSRETLVESLGDAQLRERTLLRRMVCEQEDLDWLVYEAIGLSSGERSIPRASASPEQRPFAWLTDEPPVGLDRRLTESWRRRRKAGQARGPLQLLESAPHKRAFRAIEDDRGVELDEPRAELELDAPPPAHSRRSGTDYTQRTALACERWLLDRLEETFRDAAPRCASVRELASRLGTMTGVPFVMAVLSQERSGLSAAVSERRVFELLSGHAVPYLAALRHTELGLEKRAAWEASWALLRRQDAGEPITSIPEPPRYDPADYRDAAVFGHRGKLDVPTERFIAYPGDGDAEPRYGWAGWTRVQQAEVLVALMEQCRAEGRAEYSIPLLAGILELVSWMPSWDGTVPVSGSAAEMFQLRVQHETARLGLDVETLRAWRPAGQGKESRQS